MQPPDGFTVTHGPGTLLIQWPAARGRFRLPMRILGNVGVSALLVLATANVLRGPNVLGAVLCGVLALALASGTSSRTRLSVGGGRLKVVRGPAWFEREVWDLETGTLTQIRGTYTPGRDVSGNSQRLHHLVADGRDGIATRLVSLDTPEEVRFVETTLEAFLGIRDRPELTDLGPASPLPPRRVPHT